MTFDLSGVEAPAEDVADLEKFEAYTKALAARIFESQGGVVPPVALFYAQRDLDTCRALPEPKMMVCSFEFEDEPARNLNMQASAMKALREMLRAIALDTQATSYAILIQVRCFETSGPPPKDLDEPGSYPALQILLQHKDLGDGKDAKSFTAPIETVSTGDGGIKTLGEWATYEHADGRFTDILATGAQRKLVNSLIESLQEAKKVGVARFDALRLVSIASINAGMPRGGRLARALVDDVWGDETPPRRHPLDTGDSDHPACYVCGETWNLRPYGKDGRPICARCAFNNPERAAEATRRLNERFDTAGDIPVLTREGVMSMEEFQRKAKPEEVESLLLLDTRTGQVIKKGKA